MHFENAPSTSDPVRARLSIEVYSDLICPWCYIGRKRLHEALEEWGEKADTSLHWSPFQLNPAMPAEGMERKTYRTRKFGSWARSQAMDQEVSAAGRSIGLEFNFECIHRTPNTFLGHRLLWWAAKDAKQDELCEALFRGYFSEGRDLGDITVLAAMAEQVGLSGTTALSFLEGVTGTEEVRQKEQEGHSKGISGVPFFIINDRAIISGAQPPSVFLRAFQSLSPDTPTARGENSCDR